MAAAAGFTEANAAPNPAVPALSRRKSLLRRLMGEYYPINVLKKQQWELVRPDNHGGKCFTNGITLCHKLMP
jgi:hypothetical protein